MFGIFGEEGAGLTWLQTVDTVEEARALIDAGDFDELGYVAILVMPVPYMRQVG